jgi:hypothetical protein
MGLRDKLRRLERETAQDSITFELLDGSTARFAEDEVWPSCFIHEFQRGRRHSSGEDPGLAHAFVVALRNAAPGEVERLVPTQGTCLLLWLGEDQIIRGLRERTGPPVTEHDAPEPP